VVLSAAVRPHPDSQEVAQIFKLPLDADNFFLEAHLKLRPLDFSADGIFMCGLAHSPKYADESIAQAKGAAVRALGVLAQEEMQGRAMVAWVDPEKCAVCLTCVRTCPYLCRSSTTRMTPPTSTRPNARAAGCASPNARARPFS
jgi:heterodisulfide reductase subunit A-like polyferredoxin